MLLALILRNIRNVKKIRDRLGSSVKLLRSCKKTVLLITITAAVTLIIGSLISIWLSKVTELNIPSIGYIRTRGVEGYWDKDLTNKTGACDWGTIWPGLTRNVSIYLRSISNIETTLSLRTRNWTFLNSSNKIVAGPNATTPYMSLGWSYNNAIVHPGEVLQVTLTLSVEQSSDLVEFLIANDVKAFSVEIIISTDDYS